MHYLKKFLIKYGQPSNATLLKSFNNFYLSTILKKKKLKLFYIRFINNLCKLS